MLALWKPTSELQAQILALYRARGYIRNIQIY